MNLIEYPWLNTCRYVLTAASWCAKLSKLHKKWDFWLSSPFHCLTAVISHFLEKTQDQKSLQKADLFRHFSQSLALFLLLFLSVSCSGSKDIWLWEEEKQPPQIFVKSVLLYLYANVPPPNHFVLENNRQNDLFILTCTPFLSQEPFLILSSFISCPFVFPQLKVIDSLSSPCTLLMVTVQFFVYLSPSHL